MGELEKIDAEIRRLKRQANTIRESLKPLHYELNDIPLLQARANRLKPSTVKKESKISQNSKPKKVMKISPTILKEKFAALLVGTDYVGGKVLEQEAVGPKKLCVTLSISRPEDLLEIGEYMGTLTPDVVKAEAKRITDAAEAKKKAEAAKK